MGCDIHLLLEKRVGGKWSPAQPKRTGKYSKEPEWPSPYNDRHYDLFAILAGVRNNNGFVPISEPKGFPEDMSREYAAEQESDWLFGDHSFSHLSLAEILDFDWMQTAECGGLVTFPTFVRWANSRTWAESDEHGTLNHEPEDYCQDSNAKIVPLAVFEEKFAAMSYEERMAAFADGSAVGELLARTMAQAAWRVTYAHETSAFFSKAVARMLSIAKRDGLGFEDIRCVFGFDS